MAARSSGTAGAGAAAPRRWRTLGYLLNRSWISLMFFGTGLYQAYRGAEASQAVAEVYGTSVIVLAASLAACAALHRQVSRLWERPAAEYAGPALAAAGTGLLAPWLAGGAALPAGALWGSAALTGVGSALVLLSLGRRFLGTDVRACIEDALWATLGASLAGLAMDALPFWASMAAAMALPFGTVACLHRIDLAGLDRAGASALGETIGAGMLVKLGACAAVLGILVGSMRDLYVAAGFSALDVPFRLLVSLLPAAVSLVLILRVRASRGASIETLYRPATFACLAGYALVPALGSDMTLPYAVVTTGYTLFEVLVWVILSEVASRFQYTSVQVFGFGRCIVLVSGVIAGALIGQSLVRLGTAPALLNTVAAAAIISISVLRTYVLTGADMAELGRDIAGDTGEEADAGGGADGAGRQGPEAAPAGGAGPRKVPFQRKCAIIGEYYGLTPRETDVFRLLAAGRNSVRIQEELSISAGTVNTHSYHVFQKLGAHSQQEVIDLFVHADLDAMQRQIAARGR